MAVLIVDYPVPGIATFKTSGPPCFWAPRRNVVRQG